MGKVKFTKTELKKQQDALKQFRRFLPTLQLKKQQLQMEVRQSTEMLDANLAAQRELVERMGGFLELFGSEAEGSSRRFPGIFSTPTGMWTTPSARCAMRFRSKRPTKFSKNSIGC